MSKENLDFVAQSMIPTDQKTPTQGSSYGLGNTGIATGDGLIGDFLRPDIQEPPAFPTGLARGGAAEMSLEPFLSEAPIANHAWLENVFQDPERLPERPHSIPELEEAWGANNWAAAQRTPVTDLASLQQRPKKADVDLELIATRAMRRSAAGVSLEAIEKEAVLAAGGDSVKVASVLNMIQVEHGLVGNVFIRSAAYPGYGKGKWRDHLKRYASGARYVVVSPEDLRNATWIDNGRCQITGKIAVTEVPWKAAVAHYAPRLALLGAKVASDSKSPQKALQAAFLAKSCRLTDPPAPHREANVEIVRERKALQLPTDPATRRAAEDAVKKLAFLDRMVDRQLITAAEGARIKASGKDPHAMVREAVNLARAVKTAEFSGDMNNAVADAGHIAAAEIARRNAKLNDAVRIADEKAAERARVKLASAVHRLEKQISLGLRGGKLGAEVRRAFQTETEAKQAIRLLKPAIQKYGALNESLQVASYNDVEMRQNVPVATDHSSFNRQVVAAVSWATKNAGVVSGDLRAHVKTNFPEDVARKAFDTRAFKQLEIARDSAGRVAAEIERGSRGAILRKFIATTIKPEHRKIATKLLAKVLTPEVLEGAPAETKKYAGTEFTRPNAVKASGPDPRLEPVLQWIRVAMNEGFAGHPLDDLIANKFSDRVQKVASEAIREVRATHEGAAGFFYVDAQTYATPTGIRGCEAGGLKHRANQIKAVLAMDRCGSCTLAKALPDGTLRCGTYNKALIDISDVPAESLQKIKTANMRSAGMNDAESAGALFAPPSYEDDFGLHNASLDNIQIDEPAHRDPVKISFFQSMTGVLTGSVR